MARVNPLDTEKYEQAKQRANRKSSGWSMSRMIRLHRIAGLILVVQLLIWTVTGFYFSFMGREALNAQQNYHAAPDRVLAIQDRYIVPLRQLSQLGDVYEINVRMRDELPQFAVVYDSAHRPRHEVGRSRGDGLQQAWFDAETGQRWNTGAVLAQRLAVDSYLGSGMFNGITDVRRSHDLPRWPGPGFRIDFADRLQTRVYIDQVNGDVVAHRNKHSGLTELMYKLHFMDYSGQRNFNNVFIIAAGLFSLWFVLTGIIMIIRIGRQGGFVARAGLQYNVSLFKRLRTRLFGASHKN